VRAARRRRCRVRAARASDQQERRAGHLHARESDHEEATTPALRARLTSTLDLVDEVCGVQLHQAAIGFVAKPVNLRRLTDGLPHGARRSPVPAFGKGRRCQRLEEPRGSLNLRGPVEPPGRGRVIVTPPVVHEPDVLHVLPFIGSSGQSLFKEPDGQIGTSWAGRVRLREKNCAKPVRNVEGGIQRRRQVEQGVEERVVGRSSAHRLAGGRRRLLQAKLDAAVVLDRANPVEVGGNRRVAGREPLDGLSGRDVQRILGRLWRWKPCLPNRLQRGCAAHENGNEDDEAEGAKSRRHEPLLEVAPREHSYGRGDECRDVEHGISCAQCHVRRRHRLTVYHLRADVERRQVRPAPSTTPS
jgi:hypothetical protein